MTTSGADKVLGNILRGEVRIELGGKNRLIKFNFNSLAAYSQRSGQTLQQMQRMSTQTLTLQQLRDLIFCALVEGCLIEKVPVDFDERTLGDWLQEYGLEKLGNVFDAYEGATAAPSEKKETSEAPTKN